MRKRVIAYTVVAATFAAATVTGVAAVADPPTPTSLTLTAQPGSPEREDVPILIDAALAPFAVAGTVKLYDGGTLLGKAEHYARLWSYVTSKLTVGTHHLMATFAPDDAAFAASTAELTIVIVGDSTTPTGTELSVSPTSPLQVGDAATLTAGVTPAAIVGTVAFRDGATAIGSAPVVSGVATIVTRNLAVGQHALTATFTPATARYAGSTSEPLTVMITGIGSSRSPSPSPSPTTTDTATPTPSPNSPSPTTAAAGGTISPSPSVAPTHVVREPGVADSGSQGGTLPFTGFDAVGLMTLGVTLIGTGAVAIGLGRRRRGLRRPQP